MLPWPHQRGRPLLGCQVGAKQPPLPRNVRQRMLLRVLLGGRAAGLALIAKRFALPAIRTARNALPVVPVCPWSLSWWCRPRLMRDPPPGVPPLPAKQLRSSTHLAAQIRQPNEQVDCAPARQDVTPPGRGEDRGQARCTTSSGRKEEAVARKHAQAAARSREQQAGK